MKLLHIIPSVDPKTGGPIEGVRQRGFLLEQLGHRVEIVSVDDPNAPFLKDFPLNVHALGPARGNYKFSSRLVPWLRAHVNDYEAVVINGIWQYHSFAAWRVLRDSKVPYFVFTHGMLDPWFKRAYPLKHIKKWLYWPWADYRVLRDAREVLFTSEEERLQARRSFWLYSANEQVVAYGTRSPPSNSEELRETFFNAYPHLRGTRIILFLSRIQQKKGCDLLVKAFGAVADQDPSLRLVIAGPDQAGWVRHLKTLCQKHGVSERVTWPGLLRGDLKWGAFYSAEVFVLPSHQENFGIAVAEALSCGIPVLISDKVNIWREVDSHGAGLVEPDTVDGTIMLLKRWLAMSSTNQVAMGKNAWSLFESRFTVDAMAAGLVEVVTRHSA